MTSVSNRFENLKSWHRAAVIIAVLMVFLLLASALGEGAVRLRQYLKHGSSIGAIEELYEVNEELGLRVLVAGYRSNRISINSLGFRGPEIQLPKPDGTIRVAFLGASTTFSADVSGDGAVWADLVIRRLSARYSDKRFDYINGGVPGYTISSSMKNLQLRVAPLNPDIIVIYHATNDLSSNSRAAAQRAGWSGAHGNKQLSWLSRYSVLAYLVEKNLSVWSAQRRAERLSRGGQEQLQLSLDGISEPFEADLRALVRSAYEVTDHVVLVTFSTRYREEQSTKIRAAGAVTSLYYMPFMTLQGLIDSFATYNRITRKIGRDTGTLVIGGEHDVPGTAEYFVDSVHFTDLGSERMAERIANALISHRIVDMVGHAQSP